MVLSFWGELLSVHDNQLTGRYFRLTSLEEDVEVDLVVIECDCCTRALGNDIYELFLTVVVHRRYDIVRVSRLDILDVLYEVSCVVVEGEVHFFTE